MRGMSLDGKQRQTMWIAVALAAITLLVFWPATRAEFINYDDPDYVTENSHIQSGLNWDVVRWSFTSGYAGNWHPLTWLSHALDISFFGLQPAGHHTVNVVLHALNAMLVFLLFQRLTGATWRSALVAALFALHPLRVESVAWVSERKDVLCAFFGLLSLIAYARYAGAGSRTKGWYITALLCFALGLLSKPMLVTWPCVLLLLDYWPLRRFELTAFRSQAALFKKLLREKLPFFALTLASCVITFWVQKAQGAVAPKGLPLDTRIANAFLSCEKYLENFFWPTKLAAFYPHPATRNPALRDWVNWEVGFAVVVVIVLTVMVYRWRNRRPYLLIGWLWYLGTLVPVIGILQVGAQAMADRYTYLPMIGIAFALVWLAGDWLASKRIEFLGPAIAAVGLLVGCAWLTHQQIGYWSDTKTLFVRALDVTKQNATAHVNVGALLEHEGKLDEATYHYQQALVADPNDADARNNFGHMLAVRGQLDQAEAEYRAAIAALPHHGAAHLNLGLVLQAKGNNAAAAEHYNRAIELRPDYLIGHLNLGRILIEQGKFADAAARYQAALKIDANSAAAEAGLGLALIMQEQINEGINHLQRASELQPGDLELQIQLGNAFLETGRVEEARRCYRRVLELKPDLVAQALTAGKQLAEQGQWLPATARLLLATRLAPDNAEAHDQLGWVLARQGQLEPALTNFLTSVRLKPTPDAHYHLALAYVMKGRSADAIQQYREALRLRPDWTDAMNDLAWLLATDADDKLRDGKEAVRLAERARDLNGGKEARFWGTLDAAYAEAGRFEDAIKATDKAKELATAAGQKEISEAAEQRIKLYREQKPFRQK